MKDASADSRGKADQMLKQVQGLSNSIYRFLDLVFGFKNLGSKAPPCGRGSLLLDSFLMDIFATVRKIGYPSAEKSKKHFGPASLLFKMF